MEPTPENCCDAYGFLMPSLGTSGENRCLDAQSEGPENYMNSRNPIIGLLGASLFIVFTAYAQSSSSNDQQTTQAPATEQPVAANARPPLGRVPVAFDAQIAPASPRQAQAAPPDDSAAGA